MKDNDTIDKDQLLTPIEAAREKGLSLNQFKYHLTRPGAPKPIFVGVNGHRFYDLAEVRTWQPNVRAAR